MDTKATNPSTSANDTKAANIIVPDEKKVPIIPHQLPYEEAKQLALELALTLPIMEYKVPIPTHRGPWPQDHDAIRQFNENSKGATLRIIISNDPDLPFGPNAYTDLTIHRVRVDEWVVSFSFQGGIQNIMNLDLNRVPQELLKLLGPTVFTIYQESHMGIRFGGQPWFIQNLVYLEDYKGYEALIGQTISEPVKDQDVKVTTYYVNGRPQDIKYYHNGVLNDDEVVYSYQGAILDIIPWVNGVRTGEGQRWLFGFSSTGDIIPSPPLEYYYLVNDQQVSREEYARYIGQQIYLRSEFDPDTSSVIGQYYTRH